MSGPIRQQRIVTPKQTPKVNPLEAMRIPDPELLLKYPHANFEEALRYAEQQQGPLLTQAHNSYYQQYARNVKHLIEDISCV